MLLLLFGLFEFAAIVLVVEASAAIVAVDFIGVAIVAVLDVVVTGSLDQLSATTTGH